MLVSVFLALFLPCAGMSAVFLVYICLLCYAASTVNDGPQFSGPVKPEQNKGLSVSDLEKLPRVTGKDLVLGTDCAVCLDEIESEQPARMVPGCNHGFHLECGDAWLSKKSICPVCRANIGPELLALSRAYSVLRGKGSILDSVLGSKGLDFLLSSNGSQVKISDLEGKIVGIYFSANWYPPCRKFTSLLANIYEQLKNQDPGFEVVFVSSDEDITSFDAYRASMPWLAVPFHDMETKRYLDRRFGVEDVPSLIILQPNYGEQDQNTMSRDGVDLVYRYGAQAYPFTKQRVDELVEKENDEHECQNLEDLLTNDGRDFLLTHTTSEQVPVTSLTGKTIGLYFSAQWCFPGVKFTPKLTSIYHKINQETSPNNTNNPDFEIVFVSSDHDLTSFVSYFHTMPWVAIPYGDPTINDLAKYFDVQAIPSLVIVGPDGKTVTKRGRNLVNLYHENAYPFTEARIGSLERQVDEEARRLPGTEMHCGHRHEVTLVCEGNGGGAFVCCDCDEQGFGWAYQCMECGYEVHPKCVRSVTRI